MNKRHKMEANATIGKKLPVYLVGIEYDDFDEGGFSIVAVCDNIEKAKAMRDKTHKTFPGVDLNRIAIRTYELNKFYEYYSE